MNLHSSVGKIVFDFSTASHAADVCQQANC